MENKCTIRYGKNYIVRVTIYCYICIRPCWIQLDYATAQTKLLHYMIFPLHCSLYINGWSKMFFTRFQLRYDLKSVLLALALFQPERSSKKIVLKKECSSYFLASDCVFRLKPNHFVKTAVPSQKVLITFGKFHSEHS